MRETTGRHPFSAAIEARDHPALVGTLAPDVVLHAAATTTAFEGRDTVADVYAAVIDAFEEVEVVDELFDGDTLIFFWRGRMEGRFVEGADRVRLNNAGQTREITVTGRPLSGLAAFLTGIGPRLARPRRGDAIATTLRLTARPLPWMLRVLDPIARWMTNPGRSAAR
jgi:hypothetical protein